MKFSIIIPVYNCEKYIERCILSCIKQTYNNFEIICIDDHSLDKSIPIIEDIQKQYTSIQLYAFTENKGQHIARIHGVKKAQGKYILFLDSDDFLVENALEIISEKLNTNPSDIVEFAYCNTATKQITEPVQCGITERIFLLMSEKKTVPPTVWNKAYNAQLLKTAYAKMKEFYAVMAEDFYQSIIISYYSKTYCAINDVLYNYSEGTGISMQHHGTIQTIEKKLYSVKNIIEYLNIFFRENNTAYLPLVHNLEKKLFNDMVFNHIINRTKKEDIDKALKLLPVYFEKQLIKKNRFRLFFEKIKNDVKYFLRGRK